MSSEIIYSNDFIDSLMPYLRSLSIDHLGNVRIELNIPGNLQADFSLIQNIFEDSNLGIYANGKRTFEGNIKNQTFKDNFLSRYYEFTK